MRVLVVAIILLAATTALPLSDAGKPGRAGGNQAPAPASSSTPVGAGAAPAAPASSALGSAPATPGLPSGGAAFVGVFAAGSLGLLAVGALVAHRATRVRDKRPPRKSFDAGRRLGRAERAQSTAEAAARIGQAKDVFHDARAETLGAGLRVVGRPRRGRPCEHVAGYLTGLLEATWSAEVSVHHEACGSRTGEPCRYDVLPARGARSPPGPVNASAIPAGGSRIPGSSGERHPSRPTRVGGG